MRLFAGCTLLAIASAFAPAENAGATADSAAQSAASRFEVASIKPCAPEHMTRGARGGGANFVNSPGLTQINCVVAAHLINRAFVMYGSQASDDPINAWTALGGARFSTPDLEPMKIRGGPSWVYADKFTIEAKAAGGADQKTMMGGMLRALLQDRFQLKIHQETERAEMWALTVAKDGPKFKAVRPTAACRAKRLG